MATMRPKSLNFITGNAHKLAEVRSILGDAGVDLQSKALDLVEIQGTSEEIARDKCRRAAREVTNLSHPELGAMCLGKFSRIRSRAE